MTFPLSQDYNEAVQNPATSFADADLKSGQAATNALGLPVPRSGNFADVYEVEGPAGKWAVKCFTREVRALSQRYAQISQALQAARLPFIVDFQFQEKGIRVRQDWYPILKMRWVEGQLLNEIVRDNLDRSAVLQQLVQIWVRMGKRLREAGLAHADLQHGNVIFVPGSQKSSLSVKLVDYDGMYVPGLAGQPSGEVGHPNYQHSTRLREGTYSPAVDRFPLLVVATALRALAEGGRELWQRYDNGDNLLFTEADLRDPASSPLFKDLQGLADPQARMLAAELRKAIDGKQEELPSLEDLLPEAKPATGGPAARSTPAPSNAAPRAAARGELQSTPVVRRPARQNTPAVPAWAWFAGGGAAAVFLLAASFALALLWPGSTSKGKPAEPVATAKSKDAPTHTFRKLDEGLEPLPEVIAPPVVDTTEPIQVEAPPVEPTPPATPNPKPVPTPMPMPTPTVVEPPMPVPVPTPPPSPPPPTPTTVTPVTPVVPMKPPPPKTEVKLKLPVPEAEELAARQKEMRQAVVPPTSTASAEERASYVEKLFNAGSAVTENPPLRYAMLLEVYELSYPLGSADLARKALDLLAAEYAINLLATKTASYVRATKRASQFAHYRTLADASEDLIKSAIASDDLERAEKIASLGANAAQMTKIPSLELMASRRLNHVRDLVRAFEGYQAAVEMLKTRPGDGDARVVAGKYLALGKGDWMAGLRMLGRGSDPGLKQLAEMELAKPTDPAAQQALGDGWAEVFDVEKGAYKARAALHACHWYAKMLGTLPAAARGKINQRMAEFEKYIPMPATLPQARWAFSGTARDAVGEMHGAVHGTPQFQLEGRLRLTPKDSLAMPLAFNLEEHTIEMFCYLWSNHKDGSITLRHDSLAGSEWERISLDAVKGGLWATSSFKDRTLNPLPFGSPRPNDLVHVAAVYGADHSIALYRDGKPLGSVFRPSRQADNHELVKYPRIGSSLRIAAGTGIDLDEVRLYTRALTAAEVAASYRTFKK